MLVHAYEDEAILRSINAGVKSIDHATLMTEASAKAIKKSGVWVVPFFSMLDLALTPDAVAQILSPSSVPKFLRVQEDARNQMKLLKEYKIRNVRFSTDIIGSADQLKTQNKELDYRLEAWSSMRNTAAGDIIKR